jgi:hypothetical protein
MNIGDEIFHEQPVFVIDNVRIGPTRRYGKVVELLPNDKVKVELANFGSLVIETHLVSDISYEQKR